ncbi:metal-dependent hydrolase [Halococcus agarilyticus]|uniref:metal-dependent hydrolase n=1 Tax=Halococcus agarilyticus TaxID=1232219 RepID=UPI000677A47E|nr:metal-dependent hydrolase [Halococcus agarilyticus]
MWPWGHLAFGYLSYSVCARLFSIEPFDATTVGLVVLGTQLPDLIDKPLAWTFAVLPSGRSLAHSVFALCGFSGLVWWYYRREGHPQRAIAFVVGYASHLAGDGYIALLSGRYAYLSYLGWPLLPPPPFGEEGTFLSHFSSLRLTPTVMSGVVVFAVAYVVWIEDGAPGRREIRRFLERLLVAR